MSALGQKQTYAVHNGMSALLPKATSNATQGKCPLWARSGLTRRNIHEFHVTFGTQESDRNNHSVVCGLQKLDFGDPEIHERCDVVRVLIRCTRPQVKPDFGDL